MKRIFVLLLAGVAALLPTPVRADDPPVPRPNLRILQDMMAEIADSVFAIPGAQPASTVRYAIQPSAHAWYLEHTLRAPAQGHGLVPTEAADARYDVRFGVEEIGVTYANARRTWVFGEQVMDRTVLLGGTVKIVEQGSGAILLARSFATAVHDTVPVVGIESLESPGIPATHSAPPSAGLFSSLVEPIVLIGSVAVAVYLLFSVRN